MPRSRRCAALAVTFALVLLFIYSRRLANSSTVVLVAHDQQQQQQQPEHTLRPDGLLQLNPALPHPIYHLLSLSLHTWQTKLHTASTTLKAAVAEYERRYHRAPPVGFDAWWSYAHANHVQLPDEYDQIYTDLEPFWGVRPGDLVVLRNEWEAAATAEVVIGKELDYDPIDVLNFTLPAEDEGEVLNTALEFIDLLEDVKDAIPPFRAVFSPSEVPALVVPWELRDAAVRAAAEGKYIDINSDFSSELDEDEWTGACPPTSNARTTTPVLEPTTSVVQKTFIHDHRLAMDPCIHPSLLTSHSQFLSPPPPGPGPIHNGTRNRSRERYRHFVPLFSFSNPTLLHSDIVTPAASPITTLINSVGGKTKDEKANKKTEYVEWEDKHDERLFWRGRRTKLCHEPSAGKEEKDQRERLVEYANPPSSPPTTPNTTNTTNSSTTTTTTNSSTFTLNTTATAAAPSTTSSNSSPASNEDKDIVQIITGGRRQWRWDRPWYDDDEWAYPPTGPPQGVSRRESFNRLFDVRFVDRHDGVGEERCDKEVDKEARQAEAEVGVGKAPPPPPLTAATVPGEGERQGYKFVLDINDNNFEERGGEDTFKKLLASGSLVFKASVYPQWWLDRIQPWVHYIPVQNGYEDLVDALVFFQNSPSFPSSNTSSPSNTNTTYNCNPTRRENKCGSENDDLALQIAHAGLKWNAQFARRVDRTAYVFRLMLEYARVMSLEREKMGFVYEGEVL